MCNVDVVNGISCFCLIFFSWRGLGVALATLATSWQQWHPACKNIAPAVFTGSLGLFNAGDPAQPEVISET